MAATTMSGIITPPTSPLFGQAAPLDSATTVQQEKRSSVGNGATRYPSPPLDPASLHIPPYNPNARRRSAQAAPPASSSPASQIPRSATYQPQSAGGLGAELGMAPSANGRQGGYAQGSVGSQREPKHRPVSAIVAPAPSHMYSPDPSGPVASRTRASHQIQPVTGSQTVPNTPAMHSSASSLQGMVGLNHPMPKQRIYFGPYLLLQTLGEGEFGKVKLGVHSSPDRWGEEVAIKLIKRGNVDTQARMVKVAREIDVLKLVHHPNIVRLYDVIETEKYIGIVLEYASGGELFDHILAHRYLKEKDASKLFAQLISGVMYLHVKGIVHRDLKLENLLLDRHRNIIITDFGFANRFEDQTSDLMATSCGSPCYAAPELVVQDGRYVGSAVDVWSCGVILYAMLAGYLPFDDDPANPDGDNINLLYKYIINTPLSFPEWISAEPRDLLLKMLVPDPAKRCTLEDVSRHPWLRRYAHLFDRTVQDLEMAAQEAEYNKRQSLQKQKLRLAQEEMQLQQQTAMGRSHSVTGRGIAPGSARGHQSAMVSSVTSDHLYSTGGQGAGGYYQQPTQRQQARPAAAAVQNATPPAATGRRGHAQSAIVVPTTAAQNLTVSADAFSYGSTSPLTSHAVSAPPMSPSMSAPARGPETEREDVVMTDAPSSSPTAAAVPVVEVPIISTPTPPMQPRAAVTDTPPRSNSRTAISDAAAPSSAKKRKAAARHTVQVEYAPRPSSSGRGKGRESTGRAPPAGAVAPATPPAPAKAPLVDEDVVMKGVESDGGNSSFETARNTMVPETVVEAVAEEAEAAPVLPPVAMTTMPTVPEVESPEIPPAPAPSTPRKAAAPPSAPSVDPQATPTKTQLPRTESNTATPIAKKTTPVDSAATPRSRPKTSDQSSASVPFPEPKKQNAGNDAVYRPEIPERVQSRASTASGSGSQASVETPRQARHRKGLSTDRFFSRLLGSPSSQSVARLPADAPKSSKLPPSPVIEEPRKARRKALSMVVEPLNKASTGSKPRRSGRASDVQGATTTAEKRRSRLSTTTPSSVTAQPPSGPVTRSSSKPANLAPPSTAAPHPGVARMPSDVPSWNGSAQSNNSKAKRVMDWFRFKSLNEGAATTPAPITTDFDRRRRRESRVPVSANKAAAATPAAQPSRAQAAPAVVVTSSATASAAKPANGEKVASDGESPYQSSRSASGTTTLTASTTATTVSKESTPKATRTNATPVFAKPAPPSSLPFNDSKLKLHHGAIDQSALSGKAPPLLMKDVRRVLWEMGIDVAEESSMKLKATRRSKKKVAASLGLGISALEKTNSFSQQSSPLTDRGTPLLSASTSSAGGLTPSPSSTFRSLFQRKGSSHSVTGLSGYAIAPQPSPAASVSNSSWAGHGQADEPLLMSPQPVAGKNQPLPAYSDDPSVDSGDDVRFTVEITRMKGFDKLYAVDIKRLRGSLWSFKYLYLQILEKLDLSTKGQ